jgi:hypothetical protein
MTRRGCPAGPRTAAVRYHVGRPIADEPNGGASDNRDPGKRYGFPHHVRRCGASDSGKGRCTEIIRYRCSPSALNRSGDAEGKNHLLIARKLPENSLLPAPLPVRKRDTYFLRGHAHLTGSRQSSPAPLFPQAMPESLPVDHIPISEGIPDGGPAQLSGHSPNAPAGGCGRGRQDASDGSVPRRRARGRGAPGSGGKAREPEECQFRPYGTVAAAEWRREGPGTGRRPPAGRKSISRAVD